MFLQFDCDYNLTEIRYNVDVTEIFLAHDELNCLLASEDVCKEKGEVSLLNRIRKVVTEAAFQ